MLFPEIDKLKFVKEGDCVLQVSLSSISSSLVSSRGVIDERDMYSEMAAAVVLARGCSNPAVPPAAPHSVELN